MVSSARLLAAADDSPQAAPPAATSWLAGCALPADVFARAFATTPPLVPHLPPGLPCVPRAPPVPLDRLLADLGPAFTAAPNMPGLARALAMFGRPEESAVARALLMIATSPPSSQDDLFDGPSIFQLFSLFAAGSSTSAAEAPPLDVSEWNPEALVQVVNELASQSGSPLDWRLVIRSLDFDSLDIQLNSRAFLDIAKAYVTGSGGSLLPADCFLNSWVYPKSQIAVISHALASPELVNWDSVDLFEGASVEDSAVPYARVALVERLVDLDARPLLHMAVSTNPELVLLSLSCAKPKSNTGLQQKLIVTLLSPRIAMFPASARTLKQMWNVSPALIEAGIVSMWKKDPSTVNIALDIAIQLQALPEILGSGMSVEFALDVALLAYRREPFPLEKWLTKYLGSKGAPAVSMCILHLARKMTVGTDPLPASLLSLDGVRIVLRCLLTSIAKTAPDCASDFHRVHDAYARLNARLADLAPAMDTGDRGLLVGTIMRNGTDAAGPAASPSASAAAANATAVSALGTRASSPASSSPEPVGAGSAAATAAAMLLPASPDGEGVQVSFPKDIEVEADGYFQKLYCEEMSIEQAVELLRRMKASDTPRSQNLFNFTIHTLFDEYRFFKKYPDRELKITGLLFGAVIQNSLLSGIMLGLAVRCVLDALRSVEPKPMPVGRLTKFGLCVLERCRRRLHEWPQWCSQILELPRLRELAPDLLGDVERSVEANGGAAPSAIEQSIGLSTFDLEGLSESRQISEPAAPSVSTARQDAFLSSPPMSANNTPMKSRSSPSSSLRPSPSLGSDVFSPLNMETLLAASKTTTVEFAIPDEAIQDKIKFILNNLSSTTMDDKVGELLEFLQPEHHVFFSHYVVVKRASIEPNFHQLYQTMLDKLAPHIPKLFPMVMDRSYENVRILLKSEKIVSGTTERQLLKSLGSWIGGLTLARNKPILQRDLDLKELMLDAYSTGRLIAVVPFVSKVIETSGRSKIFKPTNPWLRAMLSVMKEICLVPDIKLNVRFEFQLLCKGLGADINDIVPSDFLRDRPTPSLVNNPDFTLKKSMSSSPVRSSPSSSPSPEMRGSYSQMNAAGVGGRAGVPMFTLGGAPSGAGANGTSSVSLGLTLPSMSGSRMDSSANAGSGLVGASTGVGSEGVSDLSAILANASLSSTGLVSGGQVPRSSFHGLPGVGSNSGQSVAAAQQQVAAAVGAGEGTVIPNLAQHITVSPTLALFQNSPNLKRLLPIAVDRAVREIIQPVVERSCAIASLTTRELTMKDFANEPDVSKIRKAALQMVQQLAGSLALVTCKEPLRVSMGNHLRSLLTPAVGGDQNLIDQTAQVVCAANLEVGCAIIERAAKDKAARDLNEVIGTAFNLRRPQQSAYGMNSPPGPEVLHVYDDFARLPRTTVPATASVPASQALYPGQPSAGGPQAGGLGVGATTRPIGPSTQRLVGSGTVTDRLRDGRSAPEGMAARLGNNVDAVGNLTSVQTRGAQLTTLPIVASRGSTPPVMAPPEAMAAAMLAIAGAGNATSAAAAAAQATQSSPSASSGQGEEALSTQQVLERFNAVYPQLTDTIADVVATSQNRNLSVSDLPSDHPVNVLWVQIPSAVKRSVTADEAGMAVAQKVFKRLYEGDSSLYREIHVSILDGLRESCRRLSKELVSWLAYSEEHKKLNRECIVALLKPGSLLHITNYDELLAKTIDNGRNGNALEFAAFLVQRAVIDEPLATAAELSLTIETMAKVGRRAGPPGPASASDALLSLVEKSRSVVHQPLSSSGGGPGGDGHHSTSSSRVVKEVERVDPVGAREFVARVLSEWQKFLASDTLQRSVPEQRIATFLAQVRTNVLTDEDARDRFFRLTVDMVCKATAAALQAQAGASELATELADAPYTAVESTVRLIVALCRPEVSTNVEATARGLSTMSHFLIALVKDIVKNAGTGIDMRPHFRIFSGLVTELAIGLPPVDVATAGATGVSVEPDSTNGAGGSGEHGAWTKADSLAFLDDKNAGLASLSRGTDANVVEMGVNMGNFQLLSTIAGALKACAPSAAPGFAFSWLQLISNREVLPRLLSSPSGKGWPLFRQLLVSMLAFLSGYLRSPERPLTSGIRTLYKGTLRVLLVLLHDFPEFLCDYHFALCDVIPQNCIQLRNLVLAAFPKNMRLPDPFLPELKVDTLPEMASQPRVLSNCTSALIGAGIKGVIDNFLQNATFRASVTQLDLVPRLVENDSLTGTRKYNIPAVNALVLYAGQHALARSAPGSSPVVNGPSTELLQALTRELDAEGQYHLFNAITNQLRYPNSHTHFYSCVLLFLFRSAPGEGLKEQITRVLVERLIANRPHPWGLLITFIELIKNPAYNFWGHGFVRSEGINQIFENVAIFSSGSEDATLTLALDTSAAAAAAAS